MTKVSKKRPVERGMYLRYPAASENHLAFVYADDIWIAEIERMGAQWKPLEAHRLTSLRGQESNPRFSPNGQWLAFDADYAGSRDVWVISVEGGLPRRLTFHPRSDRMVNWVDDRSLLLASGRDHPFGDNKLYLLELELRERQTDYVAAEASGLAEAEQLVPQEGPKPIPVGPASFGAIHRTEGGARWKLAFQRSSREFGTFKGYRGGLAPDIWIADLEVSGNGAIRLLPGSDIKRFTNHPATDSHPMWMPGAEQLFFLSDRKGRATKQGQGSVANGRRYHLWKKRQIEGGRCSRITEGVADLRDAYMGAREVLWGQLGELYRLPLNREGHRNGHPQRLEISLLGHQQGALPRWVKTGRRIDSFDLSEDGSKIVVESRGQIFLVEGQQGPVRRITKTSGVAHRFPTFRPRPDDPDEDVIFFFCDPKRDGAANREYQLSQWSKSGGGVARLPNLKEGFYFKLFWAPDGKCAAFFDHEINLRLLFYDEAKGVWSLKPEESLETLKHEYGPTGLRVSWCPCGSRLAFSARESNGQSSLWIWDRNKRKPRRITGMYYRDSNPVFVNRGRHLVFRTQRDINLVASDFAEGFVAVDSYQLAAIPLDVQHGFLSDSLASAAKQSENKEAGDQEQQDSGEKNETDHSLCLGCRPPGNSSPTEVEELVEILPAPNGRLVDLRQSENSVFFLRLPNKGSGTASTALQMIELRGGAITPPKTVLSDVFDYLPSRDGTRVLVELRSGFHLIKAAADQEAPEKETAYPVFDLGFRMDPREEWEQIFHEAWRLVRDFRWRGLEDAREKQPQSQKGKSSDLLARWDEARVEYRDLLGGLSTRWDLNTVLNEMLGELGTSHSDAGGGDGDRYWRRASKGFLGGEFVQSGSEVRVQRALNGGVWTSEVRSPLRLLPGVDQTLKEKPQRTVRIVALNGETVEGLEGLWRCLEGQGGKAVEVSYRIGRQPATEVVRLLDGSQAWLLRYRDWVERQRLLVEDVSSPNESLGYVHIPSFDRSGRAELLRQYLWQLDKHGILFDVRFNGGGTVYPDEFLRLLVRVRLGDLDLPGGGRDSLERLAHDGPKALLVNGHTMSFAELFAYFFKERGVGGVYGGSTAGYGIGVGFVPSLLDGGTLRVPNQPVLDELGVLQIENKGVFAELLPQTNNVFRRAIEALLAENNPHHSSQPKRERRRKSK